MREGGLSTWTKVGQAISRWGRRGEHDAWREHGHGTWAAKTTSGKPRRWARQSFGCRRVSVPLGHAALTMETMYTKSQGRGGRRGRAGRDGVLATERRA